MRIRWGIGLPGPLFLTGGDGRRRVRRPNVRAVGVLIILGLVAFEAFRHFILGSW